MGDPLPDVQPKPTAADVLRQVIDTFLDDRPMSRMGPQQERAWLVDVLTAEAHRALAAAGLLAAPEHDEALAALTRFREQAIQVATSPPATTFADWLAEHGAQVAAQALREAADDPEIRDGNRPWVEWFLTDRAARIEAGDPT